MVAVRSIASVTLLLLTPAAATAQWSSTALLEGRSHIAAAAAPGQVWFGGGIERIQPGSIEMTDLVEVLDVATGQWSTRQLSSRRGAMAAVSVGTQVLFAGGLDNHGDPPYPTPEVDIFDVAGGGPVTALLSEARTNLAAVAVGDLALFAGGYGHLGESDVVDVYDSATGAWSTTALSQPRDGVAATVVGDTAFFAGGGLGFVDVYDSSTGTWSSMTLPTAAGASAATTVGERAVFSNGDSVDVFDTSNGTWDSLTHPIVRKDVIAAAAGHTALFVSGRLYDPARDFWYAAGTVDLHDFDLGSWTTRSLGVKGDGIAAATLGDTALFAGGGYLPLPDCTWPECQYTTVAAVDVYGPVLGSSFCGPAVPNSTGAPAVLAALGDEAASTNDLTLWAADMPPNETGYFLASQTQSFVANPGGSDGNLCLGGTIARFRTKVQSTGPAGAFSIEVDLTHIPPPAQQVVLPGDTWSFQAWFRDGGSNNFTHGAVITFL